MTAAIEIVTAGWSTTIQDLGRPGWAHVGVSPSGAVDPELAARANRLVGNSEDAALLETVGGLVVRTLGAVVVALTTESGPRAVGAGAQVRVDPDPLRRWHYLAIRGGLAVAPVLGSRATDTLAGIGPAVPAAGDVLQVGSGAPGSVLGEPAPTPPVGEVVRVAPGPRHDWITTASAATLLATDWRIGASSRVGVRLAGPILERAVDAELASEGLVRGAIQVPPDGQPVMMLADHPTTGGYPVVAVVHPGDVATVAQRPDGTTIRLRG